MSGSSFQSSVGSGQSHGSGVRHICLDCAKTRVSSMFNPVWSPDFGTYTCSFCGKSKPGNPISEYTYLKRQEAGQGLLLVPEGWQPTSDWLPDTPRCVLATDGESHFVACFYGEVWFEAFSDTEIDSHITHWMELPEMPEEGAQ